MTRRPRRSGRRAAAYTAAATVLAADAALAADIAVRDRSEAALIAAVALGYCAVVALGWLLAYGASAAWSGARAARHDRRSRAHWRPQGRPVPGSGFRPAGDAPDGYGRRHAAPLPPTVPMPDLTQWGAYEYVGGGR